VGIDGIVNHTKLDLTQALLGNKYSYNGSDSGRTFLYRRVDLGGSNPQVQSNPRKLLGSGSLPIRIVLLVLAKEKLHRLLDLEPIAEEEAVTHPSVRMELLFSV